MLKNHSPTAISRSHIQPWSDFCKRDISWDTSQWAKPTKATAEESTVSAVSGYVAWNHTKNTKLPHSDFLPISPTGICYPSRHIHLYILSTCFIYIYIKYTFNKYLSSLSHILINMCIFLLFFLGGNRTKTRNTEDNQSKAFGNAYMGGFTGDCSRDTTQFINIYIFKIYFIHSYLV